MTHPLTAGIDWILEELVFEASPSGIAVAMFCRNGKTERALGFRWLQEGNATTYFGKNSEWILLPYDFAVPIARGFIVKYVAGMNGINKAGLDLMVRDLIESDDIVPAMGY